MENRDFCYHCNKEVTYEIKEFEIIKEYKGKVYKYTGKEAICPLCGKNMNLASTYDYNVHAFNIAYRKENDLITIEEIEEILKKYNIGKKPLSLLLGWGEVTITRYINGDMPTKEYSNTLKNINADPNYYLEILEANRGNLKSAVAYKKSKAAVLKLLGDDRSKIYVVAEYVVNKCGDITPLALQKLLYYIQGFYYAFNNKFLFENNPEAWVHGPVYRQIYAKYANYKYNPIDTLKAFDSKNLNDSELTIIDSVISSFGCYSARVLEEFTHNENPWKDARGDFPDNLPSVDSINHEAIGSYFRFIKEKYNIQNPLNINCYANYMFDNIRK